MKGEIFRLGREVIFVNEIIGGISWRMSIMFKTLFETWESGDFARGLGVEKYLWR